MRGGGGRLMFPASHFRSVTKGKLGGGQSRKNMQRGQCPFPFQIEKFARGASKNSRLFAG